MTSFVCPLPLQNYGQIVLGHGGGGAMTDDLIAHLFAPAFELNDELGDAAVLPFAPHGQLVFSTDSYVVNPPIFPGGNIGHLAVAGTVNDLAMMGATPLYLSAGFVLEEGLDLQVLTQIVQAMAETAKQAGVRIVTGDTKVVERGHGDGIYINTAGIGRLDLPVGPHPKRARPKDVLLINGTLADHGMAILSHRHGLELGPDMLSDTAPLNGLVANMLQECPEIHVLRDLTRGGLAAAANEIARQAQVGLVFEEEKIPINGAVLAACEILGIDPLQVANEGKLLAVVPEDRAQAVLSVMKNHPLGKQASEIGYVCGEHTGVVVGKTPFGSTRIVDMPVGVLLPRIC